MFLRPITTHLKETDSSYLISNLLHIYEFRKSDFSVQKIINRILDKANKGEFYQETKFNPCKDNDTLTEIQINNVLEIIGSEENKIQENNRNITKPEFFDLSLLKRNNLKLINTSINNFDNKIIFFDFFYQGCMPCVKSFPKVNELFENSDSGFVVIGIDHKLNDTLNIERFLKRFNIKYPVIIGEVAFEIFKQLNVHGWPSFIIIAPTGKILEYKTGHSESFLKKTKKNYLHKKRNATS